MYKNNQKSKQIANGLLQDVDFSCFSKDLLKSLLTHLQLDQNKICNKNAAIAEKIAQIYEIYKNKYDIYLTLPKFKNVSSQAKDFLWSIFKEFDERWNQRKLIPPIPQKPMVPREPMKAHYIIPNQNITNMFIDVPNLQSIEEIEIFQRKMFEIYKNFMPQVLNSMHMATGQYYRPQSGYPPYNINNMGSLSSIGSMSNMSGMPPMNVGMTDFGAMNNRNGMGPITTINPMYQQKPNDFYDPGSSYQSRYFYDNKMSNAFPPQQPHPMSRNDKNPGNDFRPVSSSQNHLPSMGFSFYNERQQGEEYRGGLKEMNLPYSQTKLPVDEIQRKAMYSQKYFWEDPRYENSYLFPGGSEYQMGAELNFMKGAQKDKEYSGNNSEICVGQEPRKIVKKDDEVSISNEELEERTTNNKPLPVIEVCKKGNNSGLCFHCKIMEVDPMNEVEEVLKLQLITPEVTQARYTIPKKTLQKIRKNQDKLDIQLRCMKMEKDCHNSIVWPDKARLSLDEEVIEAVTQSHNNKKRKDMPFILSKYYDIEKNAKDSVEVLVELPKGSEKAVVSNYLLGIFVVLKHSVKEMEEIILKNIMELNMGSFFANKKQPRGEEGEGEHIVIPTLDVSTRKLIRIPARGIECVHPQCFDLEDYLSLLFISPCRQWRCPVCGGEARKFCIDNEFKKVLADVKKMIKEPKEVVFYASGAKVYRYDEEEAPKREAEKGREEHRQKKVTIQASKQN